MTQLEELHKRMNERHPCENCRDGHTINELYDARDSNCIASLVCERDELKATVAELRALLRLLSEGLEDWSLAEYDSGDARLLMLIGDVRGRLAAALAGGSNE